MGFENDGVLLGDSEKKILQKFATKVFFLGVNQTKFFSQGRHFALLALGTTNTCNATGSISGNMCTCILSSSVEIDY